MIKIFVLIAIVFGFDISEFRWAAYVQRMSYCQDIDNWSCASCQDIITNITTFRYRHLVFGFMGVAHNHSTVFLTFQGGIYASQWVHGFLDPYLISPSNSQVAVHAGFWKAYQRIKHHAKALKNLTEAFPDYNILVMGHSYGGAIATMVAYEIALGNYNIPINKTSLLTIGGPRVGNQYFAKVINEAPFQSVNRLVHSNDIIAHIGPIEPIAWYKNLQDILLNTSYDSQYTHFKGEVWMDPERHEWILCNDRRLENGRLVWSDYLEATNCSATMNTVSIKAHLSYWSQKGVDICTQNAVIEYLPTF